MNGNKWTKEEEEILKDNGWLVRKINGKWYEFCSKECYRNFLKKARF